MTSSPGAASERQTRAERFEAHRSHLRAVSYRILGSLDEADDAVQEAWLRFDQADTTNVRNLGGWLTTVVSRVCLTALKARRKRHEDASYVRLPDPLVSFAHGRDPEQEVLLADSLRLAMWLMMETLSPAERIALVLHDGFGISFAEIATILDRTTAATRQLASRARRRVRSARVSSGPDGARQREVVEAFRLAARAGDLDALLELLHPEVLLRNDHGAARPGTVSLLRGPGPVASGAVLAATRVASVRLALVDGVAGLASWGPDGRPFSVMRFTVLRGKIVSIDVLSDPLRLHRLGLPSVEGKAEA